MSIVGRSSQRHKHGSLDLFYAFRRSYSDLGVLVSINRPIQGPRLAFPGIEENRKLTFQLVNNTKRALLMWSGVAPVAKDTDGHALLSSLARDLYFSCRREWLRIAEGGWASCDAQF